MRQLLVRGGDVRYCDPWVDEIELDGARHSSVEWSAEEMRDADCVVVLTAHRQFLEEPLWEHARLIVDTRNVVPDANVRESSEVLGLICGARSLILGAGYMGAALAEVALEQDHDVTLADNWYLTDRDQLEELEREGARVETADIRDREDLERLLAQRPDRVYLLAAQASRLVAERDPDYTESTNVTGARRVAEALAAAGVPAARVRQLAERLRARADGSSHRRRPPAGPAARPGAPLEDLGRAVPRRCTRARTASTSRSCASGSSTAPASSEHDGPENQTVVDKFCRLAAAGEPLQLDDGGKATIGVVHVEDAACIMLDRPPSRASRSPTSPPRA